MFVSVRSYDNYIPAHMMLQRLEEEGIKGYLKDEHTVTIDPILSNAIGGIKLMIYEQQVERALSLIESFEQSYHESVECPNCQSHNIAYIPQRNTSNWFSAILTWMFGSYAIAPKKVYHCYNCGFEAEQI